MSDLYILRIGLSTLLQAGRSWEYINRSQLQECRNWERGLGVSFIRIQKSDFRYSVGQKSPLYCGRFMGILLIPRAMANTSDMLLTPWLIHYLKEMNPVAGDPLTACRQSRRQQANVVGFSRFKRNLTPHFLLFPNN